MADTVIEATQFNVEQIKYTTPKAGGAGGKSLNILNKKTNTRLNLSTPVMLTWGASDFVDPNTGKGNGKFEMSLQFPTEEYVTPDLTQFLDNMKKFEQKIKDDAFTYSKEWFGKQHKSAEVVEALYSPMLKYSKDRSTGEPDLCKPPSLRVKIPLWEGVWRCEIYSEDGTKLFPNEEGTTPVELIPKATQVSVLMTCGGIWFANGKFGVTWKLVQAMVQKPRATLSGQCFLKIKTPVASTHSHSSRSPSPQRNTSPFQEQQKLVDVNDTDSEVDEEENHSGEVIPKQSQCDEEFGVTTDDIETEEPATPTPTTTVQSVVTSEPKKARKVVKKKSNEN